MEKVLIGSIERRVFYFLTFPSGRLLKWHGETFWWSGSGFMWLKIFWPVLYLKVAGPGVLTHCCFSFLACQTGFEGHWGEGHLWDHHILSFLLIVKASSRTGSSHAETRSSFSSAMKSFCQGWEGMKYLHHPTKWSDAGPFRWPPAVASLTCCWLAQHGSSSLAGSHSSLDWCSAGSPAVKFKVLEHSGHRMGSDHTELDIYCGAVPTVC